MEDFQIDDNIFADISSGTIGRWTFDNNQSLSDLHPFCDTANTGTLSDEVFSDWFGKIEVPVINYKVFLSRYTVFVHKGIVLKAEIISIIEKYMSLKARCITLFKANMERMRYKSSNSTAEDAKAEIEHFAQTMKLLSSSCLEQVEAMGREDKSTEKANFLSALTEKENDAFCLAIFSNKMGTQIKESERVFLSQVLGRNLKQTMFLIGQRRKQLKKFEKERKDRPKWIPLKFSDDLIWKYVRGEIISLYPESQPTPSQL